MVLPPYVYSTDAREMTAHVSAIIAATPLPCMLYNNPVAYKTDFTPRDMAALAARHANLVAVKESSADVRRVTDIRATLGDRLAIAVGVDDLIVEGIDAGATARVAGLVNALPRESVALFALARRGDRARAAALYRWFLPLLRMDVVPKFVQLIKLVQERVGMGSARVRAPRLVLDGAELAEAEATIAAALAARPAVWRGTRMAKWRGARGAGPGGRVPRRRTDDGAGLRPGVSDKLRGGGVGRGRRGAAPRRRRPARDRRVLRRLRRAHRRRGAAAGVDRPPRDRPP